MNLAQIEKISKALADKTRLAVYQAIARRTGTTCGQLAKMEKVTPATISHHLRILVDAGLIACRKKGQFLHSEVARGIMQDYGRTLQQIATGRRNTRVKKRRTPRLANRAVRESS